MFNLLLISSRMQFLFLTVITVVQYKNNVALISKRSVVLCMCQFCDMSSE